MSRRPLALKVQFRTSFIAGLGTALLVAAGCSVSANDETEAATSTATATGAEASETVTSSTSTSSESTETGSGGDGTPMGEWCYGDPGPDPDWAFGQIGGTYQVTGLAACPPFFSASTVYDINVDASTRTVSFVTDLGSRMYTWDEDPFDGVCEVSSQFPGGFEIWILDDAENGVGLAFSEGGVFERFQGFIGSPIGCTYPAVPQ